MDFFSLKFFIFFLGSIVVFYSFPAGYRVKVALPALNVIFILTFIRTVTELIPLAVFLSVGFLGIRLIHRWPKRILFIGLLGGILGIFIYLKKYAFVSALHFIEWPYLTVGLSYILFRIAQMLIDVYQQEITERISGVSYFNFCCNFFTFISGPIQSYQDYKQQESHAGQKMISDDQVFTCISRMTKGFFKVVVISILCKGYHNFELSDLQGAMATGHLLSVCRKFILTAFLYTLYLFFNFSGYMDIVIGLGRLFGFELPENFNRPFASRSFLEFWSRWHITLSDWFKSYVFNPFFKFLAYRWPSPATAPYLGVVTFFVTFFIMGLWHGSSWSFVVYGLLLGAGMSINKLFDVLMRKYFSKAYQKVTDHEISVLLGQALTFTYFSIALGTFWLDFSDLAKLAAQLGISGFLICFLGGGIISAFVIFMINILRMVFERITTQGAVFFGNYSAIRIWFAFLMLVSIVFNIYYGDSAVPEFVYKAF